MYRYLPLLLALAGCGTHPSTPAAAAPVAHGLAAQACDESQVDAIQRQISYYYDQEAKVEGMRGQPGYSDAQVDSIVSLCEANIRSLQDQLNHCFASKG